VLRKHSIDDAPCSGSDRPAVGEVSDLHLNRPTAVEQRPADQHATDAADRQVDPGRIASVA
jgi:hypothetical protein